MPKPVPGGAVQVGTGAGADAGFAPGGGELGADDVADVGAVGEGDGLSTVLTTGELLGAGVELEDGVAARGDAVAARG